MRRLTRSASRAARTRRISWRWRRWRRILWRGWYAGNEAGRGCAAAPRASHALTRGGAGMTRNEELRARPGARQRTYMGRHELHRWQRYHRRCKSTWGCARTTTVRTCSRFSTTRDAIANRCRRRLRADWAGEELALPGASSATRPHGATSSAASTRYTRRRRSRREVRGCLGIA